MHLATFDCNNNNFGLAGQIHEAGMRIVRTPEGEAMEQAKKDLVEHVITLDAAYRDIFGGAALFGGEGIGVVDICLAPYIPWLAAFQSLGSFKLPECPLLNAWMPSVMEHPSVKEAMTLCPTDKLLDFTGLLRSKFLEAPKG